MLDRTVRYVDSGDGQVAYSVFGSGPVDLLLVGHFSWHLEAVWDYPDAAAFYERLASFARVVMWNVRGVGLSDRLSDGVTTLDSGLEDVLAVLEAIGMDQVAVFGVGSGIPLASILACTYPERVSALVVSGDLGRPAWEGLLQDAEPLIEEGERLWGSGVGTTALISPSRVANPGYVAWVGRMERLTATPKTAAALLRAAMTTDISTVLSCLAVPTLVIHMSAAPLPDSHFARLIPNARYLEIEGDQDWCGTDRGRVANEIEEFLTGERPELEVERVLTTIVFTDIVGSTQRAAAVGDYAWRSLLDAHNDAVRDQLHRYRGREVNTTGDGVVAAFDGPARAVRCAKGIIGSARGLGMEIRVGVHSGECEVRGQDLVGIAVHIAARVGALARPGEVLVSSTVKDLVVGSNIEFSDRGEHELRGVPGTWRLYSVVD